ncbi:Crp/Fnr family transcriptional regulator [Cognatilysobacter terrigena]|uniref:Crp/Fnr family transcriptional regulator n=1 Tax=Cognatilysobacter terrigena TaxID=2488749 RepID=UPI001FE42E6E|nr:Crp/Fnr family transcriptional regulator [Lysobacter terrigena]
MPTTTATPWKVRNGLLETLSHDECDRLRPDLHVVELQQGKTLYSAGMPQTTMYFPRSGVVSMTYTTEQGESTEIAMIGREGMVGTSVLMDSMTTPSSAVVQVAGEALALRADIADREFRKGGHFQFMAVRYMQVLLAQMAQTAVCNRHHSVEKQLCRWLLLCHDRIGTDELQVTQETIATRLGVRREAVTEAAGRLQVLGLIRCGRGRIWIVDRKGLEKQACECYTVVRREYDRLLPPHAGI